MQYKNNWTMNTGDLRGKNLFLSKRSINAMQMDTSGADINLTPNHPFTLIFNSNVSGQSIILPDATKCDLNWRVEIINLSETAILNIFRNGIDLTSSPDFTVAAKSQKTLILTANDDAFGTWVLLKTGEMEINSKRYGFVRYISGDIGFATAVSDSTQKIVTIESGKTLKSVKIKSNEAFDNETYISIGTTENPDAFIDHYDLTTEVSDDNFIKELIEIILSNENDTDLIATFYFTDEPTQGNVQITIEYQSEFIPYRLTSASFTINQPIGSIWPYIFTDKIPDGFCWLNGEPIENFQTNYPEFYDKLEKNPSLVISLSQWESELSTKKSVGRFAWDGTSLRPPAILGDIRGTNIAAESGQTILNHGNIFWQQTGKEDPTIFYPYIMCLANRPQEVKSFVFGED